MSKENTCPFTGAWQKRKEDFYAEREKISMKELE